MDPYGKFSPSSPYIPIRISHPITNYGNSIYGGFDGVIQTVEQAKKIMEIADMARAAWCYLSDKDKNIELRAFDIVSNSRRQKEKYK